MAISLSHGSKGKSSSSREEKTIKKFVFIFCMLAGPVSAQAAADTLVRFTGFLGNLQFTADDLRADLVTSGDDMARVAIKMDDDAAGAFLRFTTTHVNREVTFFVCGQQMQSVTVQAPIETGSALSDMMPLERAQDIVSALNGEGVCP